MNPSVSPYDVPKPLLPWWQNPGLWLGLATPVIAVVNQRFGLHLSAEELIGLGIGLVPVINGLFGQHVQHNSAAMNVQSRMMAASSRNSGVS